MLIESSYSAVLLITNMLRGPSASEIMTVWRYANLFIIIIITTWLWRSAVHSAWQSSCVPYLVENGRIQSDTATSSPELRLTPTYTWLPRVALLPAFNSVTRASYEPTTTINTTRKLPCPMWVNYKSHRLQVTWCSITEQCKMGRCQSKKLLLHLFQRHKQGPKM